jgi:very-short-patch-repair endonuclease
MDERLLAVAMAREGVFAWRDAERVGVDTRTLARLIRGGQVRRLRRGAYLLEETWAAADPRERARLRALSVIHSQPRLAASHESALLLHALPTKDVPTIVDGLGTVGRSELHRGLRVRPRLGVPSVAVGAVQVVLPAWAIVQTALASGVAHALIPLDHALHAGSLTLDDLVQPQEVLLHGQRGSRIMTQLLALADARCESPGETQARLLLTDLGYAPRSQVVIRLGSVTARADFVIDEWVVVEYDGALKYDGLLGRAALVAEKEREDALTAAGYVVVRLVAADLTNPTRVRALIEAARATAGRRGA